MVRSLQPDVILMDIEMPILDGLVTTAAMRTVAPRSAVVNCLHDDAASREKTLAAGATAFVDKNAASESLLTAIRDAAHSAT